ncbi:hypothetical protein AADS67_004985 [Escherichia coli]|nr:hypothetical protein [Serratia marcescens]
MHTKFSLSSLFAILALQATSVLPAQAQSFSATEEHTMTHTTHHPASAFIPATHVQVARRDVSVDGEAATLTRYERQDGRNAGLEGEHFSAIVAENDRLKGFANISLDLVGRALPSRERSEEVARTFLQQHAPDLLPRMEIHWIDAHDEPIRIERDGRTETVTLTGMKVKARNLADKRWFWVIVGADEQPMVFERDITWVTFPGHRKTEKWLHDSWLKQQGQQASGTGNKRG